LRSAEMGARVGSSSSARKPLHPRASLLGGSPEKEVGGPGRTPTRTEAAVRFGISLSRAQVASRIALPAGTSGCVACWNCAMRSDSLVGPRILQGEEPAPMDRRRVFTCRRPPAFERFLIRRRARGQPPRSVACVRRLHWEADVSRATRSRGGSSGKAGRWESVPPHVN